MRAAVEKVLVESGRAVGVRLVGGEELRAPLIISNAGARNTYLKLLGEEVAVPFRDELRASATGFANVTVYLGLKDSPADLGVTGGNFWMFDSLDHDQTDRRRDELLEGKAHFAFLSFPSMKDPLAKAHTAEIIAPVSFEAFAKWRGGEWKKKGAEYQALKDQVADELIRFVDERLPGFAAKVAFREVSTPLSTEYFTDHPGGEIYGFTATPERLRSPWIGAVTPVKNFYLTGADACAHGIGGALMGGLICTAAIEGLGAFRKIGAAASRASKELGVEQREEGHEGVVVTEGVLGS
jgi:phytoene dehydrogenase-like protein